MVLVVAFFLGARGCRADFQTKALLFDRVKKVFPQG